jgi:hypothetical protein
MSDNMFDPKELNDLDKQISDRLARPSLIGKMKAKNKSIQSTRLLDWGNELRHYWFVYVFLSVSAVFTMTLGFYMGVAPKFDAATMTLTYQTDILHLILAFVYMIAFVTVTEVAFIIAKRLFFVREEANLAQQISSIIMMVIAGASILGTGIAGGMVIASQISFLTSFISIPDAAQKWVVVAIPILITIYTILVTIYALSSDTAASERLASEQKRASELDNATRTRAIEQIANEQLQVTELKRYMQLVSEGKMTAAEAQAAIRAGRTLGQEEIRQRRDIDGIGGIGNKSLADNLFTAKKSNTELLAEIAALKAQVNSLPK